MAATMEHAETTRLAHHLEDLLADCRQSGRISGVEIDWLLEAVDLLELLLDDIRNGRSERSVDNFIATIPESLEVDTGGVEEIGTVALTGAGQGFLIQLQLQETVVTPGPRLLVLLNALAKLGTVLESTPSTDDLLQGDSSHRLLVRLESDSSQEQVHQQLRQYSELQLIIFPAEPAEERSSKKRSMDKTVRVSTELLDHFINLTGELITTVINCKMPLKSQIGRN